MGRRGLRHWPALAVPSRPEAAPSLLRTSAGDRVRSHAARRQRGLLTVHRNQNQLRNLDGPLEHSCTRTSWATPPAPLGPCHCSSRPLSRATVVLSKDPARERPPGAAHGPPRASWPPHPLMGTWGQNRGGPQMWGQSNTSQRTGPLLPCLSAGKGLRKWDCILPRTREVGCVCLSTALSTGGDGT